MLHLMYNTDVKNKKNNTSYKNHTLSEKKMYKSF